jgi:starvation-inducible DNA-binding protein
MSTKTDLIFHMNKFLANLHVLDVKIHNFHWNITGPEFFTLHTKFESLYNEVEDTIDTIAERILMVGGKPTASMKIYLEHTDLREVETRDYTAAEALKELKEDYTMLLAEIAAIGVMANDLGDDVTADMVTTIKAAYEKNIWMLSASLK